MIEAGSRSMDAWGFHDRREVFGDQFADGDENFLPGKTRCQSALNQILQIRFHDIAAILKAFFRNGEAIEFVHCLSFQGNVTTKAQEGW
ncbi:hypothetical protein pRL100449 (plasmid) [Rhizobium johnstonii 3841]|uniref:Uncharacterized protein n=1 Tax=Rhizobium johnstonii (strain DSM 114642 / LMG 32736 / 3841) TaxID=216596 RepID=Q1M757_RHIJ3|nr:hypothetical protein pRL100449 [Rhizobium johnstonii 3841]